MPATLRRGGDIYAPPRNDAYVVLLIIALVAMILGCALLWLDYRSYPEGKAPTKEQIERRSPPPQPPAAGGAGGQQGGAGAQGGAPQK